MPNESKTPFVDKVKRRYYPEATSDVFFEAVTVEDAIQLELSRDEWRKLAEDSVERLHHDTDCALIECNCASAPLLTRFRELKKEGE
jgi:hypothetical protein